MVGESPRRFARVLAWRVLRPILPYRPDIPPPPPVPALPDLSATPIVNLPGALSTLVADYASFPRLREEYENLARIPEAIAHFRALSLREQLRQALSGTMFRYNP